MIENTFPIWIILIYLIIIFLISYYKNIVKKNKKNYKVNLENINPIEAIYFYNNGKTNKLFYYCLLNLIEKRYYKLEEKENEFYLVINDKKIVLEKYEIILVDYINSLFNKEIELEKLLLLLKSDSNYEININNFNNSLKEKTQNYSGQLDKISIYIIPFIITFIYSIQVIIFLELNIKIFSIILLSVLFSLFTLLLTDLIKHKFKKYTIKDCIKVILLSLFLSIISSYIWNELQEIDYIIFHVLMGIMTFMYPLLIIINKYQIKTNTNYINKIQEDINIQIIEHKKTLNKQSFIYLVVFKIYDNNIKNSYKYFIKKFLS